MKRLSLVAALMLASLPAQAQLNPSPNDPQAPVEIARFKGDLSDFGTVEILCNSDSAGDYLSTALCTAADNEIRTLAQRYHLNIRQGGGNEGDDSFTFFIRITSAGQFPRAVAVQVEASRYMKEAVDQSAGYRDPAAFRRPGKLVMYQETITGVGQGDGLEGRMRLQLRRVIQAFFASRFKD